MIGTVEELRRYLHTAGGGGTSDDDLLGDLLAAADDRFRNLTADRTLEPTPASDDDDPVALSFTVRGRVLQVPDLRAVESITVNGAAYTGTYRLRGRPGQPAWWIRFPYRLGSGGGDVLTPPPAAGIDWSTDDTGDDADVVIVGRWGPADEPAPSVKEAVLIWAARVYQERAARWSDARQDPDGGVASYFRSVPPSIQATINALRIPGL